LTVSTRITGSDWDPDRDIYWKMRRSLIFGKEKNQKEKRQNDVEEERTRTRAPEVKKQVVRKRMLTIHVSNRFVRPTFTATPSRTVE